MIAKRFWVCLLLPVLCVGTCSAEDAITFQTDWLVPSVEIDGEKTAISAIDLEITRDEPNGLTGMITLYSGMPSLDPFGDADRSTLPSRKVPVTFRKVENAEAPNDFFSPRQATTGELYVTDGDPTFSHIRLVLDTETPSDCRILIVDSNENISRVLPLQSERLQRLAEQAPKSDPSVLSLFSGPILSDLGSKRLGTLQIAGRGDQITILNDGNHLGFDRLGNIMSTTLMGFIPSKLNLIDLNLPDATGQARRVYRCVATRPVDRFFPETTEAEAAKESKTEIVDYVVLHPQEGGWHRFISLKSGQPVLIAPMHSLQLRNWLRTSSQIKDATERQVFEKISQEIPYFNGLVFENGQITGATISFPEGKEDQLLLLAKLPHLVSLKINGDLAVGAPLDGFQTLEHLHFAHGRIAEDVLRHVSQLPQLKSLSFYTVHLDCNGMKHLSGLQSLNHFHFWKGDAGNFAENYDDSGMGVFSTLPNLESLHLHALPLTEVGIGLLPVSKRLAKVSFNDDAPIPAVLNYAKLNPQAEIDISSSRIRIADGVVCLPSSVTDEDLELLATIEGLRELSLGQGEANKITDKGLGYLSHLKLTAFTVNHNKNITDDGIESLSKIQSLEELNFWYCEQLTNQCIPDLAQLPNLKRINIGGTRIDPKLLQVVIPNCKIDR